MDIRLLTFFIIALVIKCSCGRDIPVASEQRGLYNSSDKVLVLSSPHFKDQLFNKGHANLVEFYNTYCGHCKRFAPTWKEFAEENKDWRDVVHISAFDCADDLNNEVCREYEILAYPTLRMFPPNFKGEGYGTEFPKGSLTEMRENVIKALQKQTPQPENWPDWKLYSENLSDIPTPDPDEVFYLFVLTEPENSTIAMSAILDLHTRLVAAEIYRANTTEATTSVKVLDGDKKIVNANLANGSRDNIVNAITEFLDLHGQKLKEHSTEAPLSTYTGSTEDPEYPDDFVAQITELKNTGTIFQSDLELAIQYTLFHEIPSYKLDSDKILTLQNYLTVLAKHAPLGINGKLFLRELRDAVVNASNEIDIETYLSVAKSLQTKHEPIFSSSKWVGCYSRNRNLRRFPCGLWSLFHYLTVQSSVEDSDDDNNNDALEVLQVMHKYIKNFFGCSECSEHFQEMAAKRKIWSVPSKVEAVLWLWEAHNEVNNRLAEDATTDQAFPKLQFPTAYACPTCRKPSNGHVVHQEQIEWNKTEVLFFLTKIYASQNLHRLGIDNPTALASTFMEADGGHPFGRVFTELDMRMGILLYIGCIVMMIVAVKIFLKRGYRKKLYVHDILGKV